MDDYERLLVLEKDVAHIDKTLSEVKVEMKSGFEKVDVKCEALNKKVDALKDFTIEGFKEVNKKISDSKEEFKDELKKDLKWTVGIFGGGVVALAALMYFLFSRIPVPTVETKAMGAVSTPAPVPMPGSAIPATKPVTKQQDKKDAGQ